MKKYMIDMDIGDDIDDAFALDMALKAGVNLIGLTTVYRNTVDRAKIAKRMLSLYGKKDIPVYFGYGNTLDGRDEKFPLCQWTKELENAEYAPDNQTAEEAVDAILNAARTYKKDFVLMAIGPLTNVARAIQKDAEAMRGIGGLVLMGGDYVNEYAEWNILCDVTAADIVFSSGVEITAFGHEMTSKVRISKEEQAYVFSMTGDAYHEYLAELSRLWYLSKEEGYLIILHDLLVVRYIFEPQYCTLSEATVYVETEAGKERAMMRRDSDAQKGRKIRYATVVDETEFVKYFMKSIGYKPNKEEK